MFIKVEFVLPQLAPVCVSERERVRKRERGRVGWGGEGGDDERVCDWQDVSS